MNRREVAHCPASLGNHARDDALGQKELGTYIDMEKNIELFRRDLEKRLVQRDARVVHQAIDPAQEVDRLIGQRLISSSRSKLAATATARRPMAWISATADSAPWPLWA